MHSNPIPTPRPQPVSKKRIKGPTDLYFPTIDQLKVGMRVCAYWRGIRSWGQQIDQINKDTNRVLIRHYIGGTKERAEWIPMHRIWVCWEIESSYE